MISEEKAKQFILDNARPLEKALYDCYVENSNTRGAALYELGKFQNEDGGFGHALELDNWNPHSNPIATNDALITLFRLNAIEDAGDMIEGIIRYLDSHDSFDERQRKWLFAIDTNKDYPHASWWEKDGDGVDHGYNPTVSLATLMICKLEQVLRKCPKDTGDDSMIRQKAEYYMSIVREAYQYLEKEKIGGDGIKCYILSYRLLKKYQRDDVIDLDMAKELITHKIEEEICADTTKYGVEYVSLPSDFFIDGENEFLTEDLRVLIDKEQSIMEQLQKEDGGFDISWQWWTPYKKEFEQSRTLWRARLTMDKLLFVRNYGV